MRKVRKVRLESKDERLMLVVVGIGDLRTELEALEDKGRLLFRLMDRPVVLKASSGE